MKRRLFTILLITTTIIVNAQTDPSVYLDRTLKRLEEGNCLRAQNNYNVYKQLSNKTDASVEAMIEDCLTKSQYRIGSTIDVNGEKYIIAHLTKNKQHGFAIKDEGMYPLWGSSHIISYINDEKIPSLDELEIIFNNNKKIGLTGSYWTSTVYTRLKNDGHSFYYSIDFLSGEQAIADERNNKGILLIHRF